MISRFAWLAVVAGALLISTVVSKAAGEEDVFTASPERRAKLFAEVRAKNLARKAAADAVDALEIVRDGKPLATIVTQGEAKAAAKLLNEWIKLMSGTELPIADASPNGPAIFLGAAAVKAGLNLDKIDSSSNEGLSVKCDGKNVYIATQSEAALPRAVGRFLEETFGCRWLSDRPWGQVYPQQTTLRVAKGDLTEKPGFLYRRIWGPEGAFRNGNWNIWNGHGGTSISMGHSWGFLPKGTFKEHPEWFRLDENGNRVDGHWYNIGHPEVRKRFLAWALEAGQNGLSLSPPDDHREDFSPESKKYDDPGSIDPSSGRVSMTNRFMTIANEAAAEIYKLNPKSLCGFYAYSDYTLPPTDPKLDKLSPNLCIWIAPIRFSRYHPLGHPNSPSRQLMKTIVTGWSERASSLGWRTYNYNLAEVMTPFSKITTWSHDMPYLYKRGCIGISLESFNTWELYAPHLYLSIRLAYDPAQDPWAIMADYWDKAYGPAAEPMESYWMEVDSAFVNLKTESGSYHALHHVYTPERLKLLDDSLKAAEQAVKGNEDCATRVRLARRGMQRAVYWRQWYDAINRGDVKGAVDTFNEWRAKVLESLEARDTNQYARTYLDRFIGSNLWGASGAINPKGKKPGEVIAVLPDEWKFMTGDDFAKAGAADKPWDVKLDDAAWPTVKTFGDTLNAQGYPEYFGEMYYRTSFTAPQATRRLGLHFYKADRKVLVYLNGQQVNEKEVEGFRGTTIDVTGKLLPGKVNHVTVMIRHVPLPELYLGGLVGPVYLIENGE
ncbi:MAG: DUF4838 domain-containing protein [Planctomycetota bacterium]|nr:DUF4838 domain-containing protein [Planctomycetota bacterium]MDA1137434.1 DUF4838 domain-containing protein [Planctomycetota bacterium]